MTDRHLTALARTELSRPVRALLATGLVARGATFLDYGCGRGDDVRELVARGVNAVGWDPYYAPAAPRRPSSFVNLGYVLNVIEDADERRDVLLHAWALTQQVLAVSVMTDRDAYAGDPYLDGIITQRGTFQRFFDPADLRAFVFRYLCAMPHVVDDGIVFAFRSESVRRLITRRKR